MSLSDALVRVGTTVHGKLIKATGSLGAGTDDGSLLVLKHMGAKSGKVRETPLQFVNHDGGYVVAASKAGAPTNPGWYHNLRANPDTTVTVAKKSIEVAALELEGSDRQQIWERLVADSDVWEKYESKSGRTIPLVHLIRR